MREQRIANYRAFVGSRWARLFATRPRDEWAARPGKRRTCLSRPCSTSRKCRRIRRSAILGNLLQGRAFRPKARCRGAYPPLLIDGRPRAGRDHGRRPTLGGAYRRDPGGARLSDHHASGEPEGEKKLCKRAVCEGAFFGGIGCRDETGLPAVRRSARTEMSHGPGVDFLLATGPRGDGRVPGFCRQPSSWRRREPSGGPPVEEPSIERRLADFALCRHIRTSCRREGRSPR